MRYQVSCSWAFRINDMHASKSVPPVKTPQGQLRTGLNALKAQVKVRGLQAIDRRTSAARALLGWRKDLLDDLGDLIREAECSDEAKRGSM
jgi:hypothetical protein